MKSGIEHRQIKDDVAGVSSITRQKARNHSVSREMDVGDVGNICQCIAVSYLLFVRQANLQRVRTKCHWRRESWYLV
jgi:hypothetical protein